MLIQDLAKDLLAELFWYDESTGELRWKKRKQNVVGYVDSAGYRRVLINRKYYMVHRLIWLLVVGEIPTGYQIDHIDGHRANNDISNLRLATCGENRRNSRISSNNTSGIKGVDYRSSKSKWRVRIAKNGKRTETLFATKEEAESFVRQARELLHDEFCNHGVHSCEQ